MPLPVHRDGLRTEHLYAIHADVSDPALWILRDHHRQCDERPAVLGPRRHHRNLSQVDLIALPNDLLAWRSSPSERARRKSGYLEQLGNQRQLPDETIGNFEIHESCYA